MRAISTATWALLGLCLAPARAQTATDADGAAGDSAQTASAALAPSPMSAMDFSLEESLLRLMLGLAALLLMFFLAWWLMRRASLISRVGNRRIKFIENMALSTRERLTLVEVDGVKVLVGVSPGRVNALHVWPSANAQQGEGGEAFSDVLAQARGKTGQRKGGV